MSLEFMRHIKVCFCLGGRKAVYIYAEIYANDDRHDAPPMAAPIYPAVSLASCYSADAMGRTGKIFCLIRIIDEIHFPGWRRI